jgi:hypothetical protein
LRRAETYANAGADGIFVPGATDLAELRAFADAIPLAVNVLVVPGRTLDQLAETDISRASTGSLPYRAALDAAVGVTTAVRDETQPTSATPYHEAQQRLARYAHKGQRHYNGRWWTATTGTLVGYESWLERDRLVLLDFDPDVVGIASQPFWLFWTTAEGQGPLARAGLLRPPR